MNFTQNEVARPDGCILQCSDIDPRHALLQQWAGAIDQAARLGALSSDKPIIIREIGTIAGRF